ncbi:MAG: hypothetical protein IKY18_05105 [Oscillospiraceae bacterium]|nr:hypothetical protein [Oscillospiraceae bacterium]
MFEDPKKELKALEGRMLAAEESRKDPMLDDDFETLFNEIKAEYGPRNDEPPVRNYANNYGRPAAVRPAPHPAPAPAPVPEPRKKRKTGLGFLIFLEIVALIAVLGFWALHLLG